MNSILTSDFKPTCFWWEEFQPWKAEADLPLQAQVLIIGSGFAGLSAALELSKHGIEAVIVDAREIGWGASTRNGGGVGGTQSIGRNFTGRQTLPDEEIRKLRQDAAQAFPLVRALIEDEKIQCHFTMKGSFTGAFTPAHFQAMQKRADELNKNPRTHSYLIPKEQQRTEIGSDFYYGGMVTEGSATIQPALYVKGLMDACIKRGVHFSSNNPVKNLKQQGDKWLVSTDRGSCLANDVIVATNGYTTNVTPHFSKRIIPVASHIIATEELDTNLMKSLFPNGRMLSDSKRVLYYYRPSPDGHRIIFGGRARFTEVGEEKIAALLHAALTERFPQLNDIKVSHAWTGSLGFTFDATGHMGEQKGLYYCMGCNGSGIAMMTYLGFQTARKIAAANGYQCAFDRPSFPSHPLYNGNPWFLPIVGGWYRMRDQWDRTVATKMK